jgi:isochorismate synthase
MIEITSEHALGVFNLEQLDLSDPFVTQFKSQCHWALSFKDYSLYGKDEGYKIVFNPRNERELHKFSEVFNNLPSAQAGNKINQLTLGPVAFIGMPLDPESNTTAVVPRHLLIELKDKCFYGHFGNPAQLSPPAKKLTTDLYSIYPVAPLSQYLEAVKEAIKEIKSSAISKIVISRAVVIEASANFDKNLIFKDLQKLGENYPFLFGNFVGISPELLIQKTGSSIISAPVANTISSTDVLNDPLDELLKSESTRQEHFIVVNWIKNRLEKICSEITVAKTPQLIKAADVYHLLTPIQATLNQEDENLSIISLASYLSPTPAVAGEPQSEAIELIKKLEPFDRELYSGAVGFQDCSGNGAFVLALRCANIIGRKAILYAGAGIVKQSDPIKELEETKHKLRIMLNTLLNV